MRLLHDASLPYPDIVIEIAGRIRAQDGGDENLLDDVTFVLHLRGTQLLLSREYAQFFSVAHQVEPRFVTLNPVETSSECFAIKSDLVQDEVYLVLYVEERIDRDDPPRASAEPLSCKYRGLLRLV